MAFTGNKQWYISSAKYSSVTGWATGIAKSVGDIVRQTTAPAFQAERCFVCVIAGTTAATEPTWTTTRGAKTAETSGPTWQECTGIAALNGDMANTPNWTTVKGTAVSIGHVIQSNDGTKILICDTAGTAGSGAEPTWNGVGVTTADNTVTWRTLKTASATFGAWAAPHNSIGAALATNWGDTGTEFRIGNAHNYSASTAVTWASRGTSAAPISVLCVNEAGSMPPVAADITTGAKETLTGAVGYTMAGAIEMMYGIHIIDGTSSNITLTFVNDNKDKYFSNCIFELGAGTGSTAHFSAQNSTIAYQHFDTCTFKVVSATQFFALGAFCEFTNCSWDVSVAVPTTPFKFNGAHNYGLARGCDFSNLSSATLLTGNDGQVGALHLIDCKLPSSFTFANLSAALEHSQVCTASRCANASGGEIVFHMDAMMGTVDHNTSVARTGGAADNSIGYSWNVQTNTKSNRGANRMRPPISSIYNAITAANVTLTLFGIANTAAMPTDQQAWIEADYLGASANPLATLASTRGATILSAGNNLTADTSAWDSAATARANTHAYTAGDVIALASNSGRLFFCTVSGTSAGSEPGGYASAIDGGTVTDGTATFRAGWRFKMALTFSSPQPQQVGNIYAQLVMAMVSSQIYFDPRPVLS